MAPNYSNNPYAKVQEIEPDGSVTFTCTTDRAAQVWLTLPPHHPVVIQTQSFWTAVCASVALDGLDQAQWSALTWIDWVLGDGEGGHAVRGVYRRVEIDGSQGYAIELFNESGASVVTIRGRGVVFRNRNFEKWREGSKKEARAASAPTQFTFASAEDLGLTPDERALVAPYDPSSGAVDALVTAENGLAPGNPLIGGSGDHVNSTHMHELARQALFLVIGRTNIDTSGEMHLNRYVELGTPIRLVVREERDNSITFTLEQLERECAVITLRWRT